MSEQEPLLDDARASAPRRVRVHGPDGKILVARLYGGEGSGVVLLPDGRLGWPEGLAFTDEPFVTASPDTLQAELLGGALAGFTPYRTEHYLVLSQGSAEFARQSARLLESLYQGLQQSARRAGLEVHDAEFPLVAVIYPNEEAFRASVNVPDDVEAYYDVATNRIVFYETSERDRQAPDLAARRKPQTVAHEGTHQVLSNIGVHPRLASWPIWLVEGLAEYFAPTTVTADGGWDGGNRINPFHMATIRELDDPLILYLQKQGFAEPCIGRKPGTSLVEYLVTRTELTPTDYALAWALTLYLINTQPAQFRTYLQVLGERPLLAESDPETHLAEFRHIFEPNLARMDRAIGRFLARLKDSSPLVAYAVTFEQPVGPTIVRRAALVSQSPAMIRQWLEQIHSPGGGLALWRAYPFSTRAQAQLAAESWIRGH